MRPKLEESQEEMTKLVITNLDFVEQELDEATSTGLERFQDAKQLEA